VKKPALYLFTFFTLCLGAQNKLALHFEIPDNPALLKKVKTRSSYPTRAAVEKELASLVRGLRNEGYLLAEADTLSCDSQSCTARVRAGARYEWAYLKKGNVDAEILAHTGFHEKMYRGARFSPAQVAKTLDRLVTWCENNGYPFASARLDSVSVQGNTISAQLSLIRHRFIKLDSIVLEGDARISKNFLSHYLRLREGAAYNEQSIRQVSQRLKQLPFLREARAPIVRITDNYNKLILFLDRKNASQFDGILGLQPQPGGKAVLTGDVRIRLYNNIFRAGELLDINWRRLQYQTQDIRIAASYPYLFRSPVGTDYALALYKRDTTFIDVQNNVGLQYLFNGLNHVRVFYRQRSTNLLETASLAGLTVLPEYADIHTNAYGLGLLFEKLDYKFNPRSGISVTLSGSAGNREIKKNAKLNENLYNNIRLSSTQYQAEAHFAVFVPVWKAGAIKIGVQGAGIASPQLFRNELFRIGGFRSLRGFDEQSIFASSFAIGTLEYRFLFEQNSALVVFADGGWYENNALGSYISDTPYSVGAGVSFDTKAGIFQLNYAIGSQFGNPFDFRTGKVNFGLVNTF
jgi:outer membrane protein assembly factor BamA